MVKNGKGLVLSLIKENNDPLINEIFDQLNMADASFEPLYKSTMFSLPTDIKIIWSPPNRNRTFNIRAPVHWIQRHGKLTIDRDETARLVHDAAKKLKTEATNYSEEQTHEAKRIS